MWGKVARLPGLDSCTLRSSYLRDFINPHCHLHVLEQEARWSSTYWLNWSAVNIFFLQLLFFPRQQPIFAAETARPPSPCRPLKKLTLVSFIFPYFPLCIWKVEAAWGRVIHLSISEKHQYRYRQWCYWLPPTGGMVPREEGRMEGVVWDVYTHPFFCWVSEAILLKRKTVPLS